MRINDILQESLSGILFHSTSVESAAGIISSNYFQLSEFESNYKEKFEGFYMSFSRSRTGPYTRVLINDYGYEAVVSFKINGQLLKNNYKGQPINFWIDGDDWTVDNDVLGRENEDRLIFSRDQVPNARKYIIEAEIIIVDAKSVLEEVEELLILCDNFNIPVKLYDGYNNFLKRKQL